MGWAITGFGVALVIVVVAGAALALCKRYRIGWQWGTRNFWSVCEEWRQRLSWLWAPREEKVGLVKAQHPTAQTIPGLYQQTGNTSQHLLHSDSDLRLDAQGAFTRFEPVDRDLHPPLGTTASAIPPQPLRPAPQPRSTARPRPSPLQPTSTVDYLRMQESGPGPLTPPPSLQRPTAQRSTGPSVFVFQNEPKKNYGLYKATSDHSSFRFDGDGAESIGESIQMTPYGVQDIESRLRFELEEEHTSAFRQYDTGRDTTRMRYGMHGLPLDDKADAEDGSASYGSYEIDQRNHMRQHIRNDSRGSQNSFGMTNASNTTNQTIMESIYGPEAWSKMLQSSQHRELDQTSNERQSIEMTPFRTSSFQDITSSSLFREFPGLHKVSQYTQSLPDHPQSMVDLPMYPDRDPLLYGDVIQESIEGTKVNGELASSPVPPPPAPPDPPKEQPKKNGLTAGERIFSALRSVSSQGYIDASEFYSSVRSTAQQVQRMTFSRSPSSLFGDGGKILENQDEEVYEEQGWDGMSPDDCRRSSDLDSPELNLEAHRTAQKVYDSLQDRPSYLYPSADTRYIDPSYTRTSEEIFNCLEQRLNGLNERHEMEDDIDLWRKRDYQETFSLSSSRRGSQGPDPEPPPDESNLTKARSCETVCSDTSVALNDLEKAPVGSVCICVDTRWVRGIDTDGSNLVLAVSVPETKDLVTSDRQPAQDTFASVCLLPDRQIHWETKIYRKSSSPCYPETFLFPIDDSVAERTLLIEIYSYEHNMGDKISLIGEASLRLGHAPRPQTTIWLPLVGSAAPRPQLGKLLFSLSYLPTSKRLNLVVVKASNLRGASDVPGDFFVKVYLMQERKKTHKKKTSVKKGEKSPIFNEAICFDDVSFDMLQNIQLRLTVAEINSEQGTNSKPYSVGHIIVSSKSTGLALDHWTQMLYTRGHPLAMWHPLRK